MIEKEQTTTDPREEILQIVPKSTPFNMEIKDGKIIKIKLDDSKLTLKQKTDLDNYLTTHNPQLQNK